MPKVESGPTITNPEQWDLSGRDIAPFALTGGRVVVVSAHPDDETLAIGGLLQSLHRAGAGLEMVIATDGEAAFPSLEPDSAGRVGPVPPLRDGRGTPSPGARRCTGTLAWFGRLGCLGGRAERGARADSGGSRHVPCSLAGKSAPGPSSCRHRSSQGGWA